MQRRCWWKNRRWWLRLAGTFEESGKLAQERLPLGPVVCGGEQAILHVAQELDLHNVHLENTDTRNLRPGLVRIGIVVQKLIPKHQSYREQSVLAAWLALDGRVELFESVDEEKSQQHYVLCHKSS